MPPIPGVCDRLSETGPQPKAALGILQRMSNDNDPELARLLTAEREAADRYEQLRGYPADAQVVGLAALQEAREAVRAYRAKQ